MQFCYISVDIEASVGFKVPPQSDMVSVGACVIGQPEKRFYAELRLVHDFWDPQAEQIHKLSRLYLQQCGEDPRIVMQALRTWVLTVAGGAIAVFCAMPVAFDWEYVRWYFCHFKVENPFRETLDGRDLYRRIKGLERHESVIGDMIRRDFPTNLLHTHHALQDALEQGDRYHQMLKALGRLS